MTLPAAVLSFAVVAGLLTVVPGLDTALVLRAAITQGHRPAFATARGINTGASPGVRGSGRGLGTADGVDHRLHGGADCWRRVHDLAGIEDAVVCGS